MSRFCSRANKRFIAIREHLALPRDVVTIELALMQFEVDQLGR